MQQITKLLAIALLLVTGLASAAAGESWRTIKGTDSHIAIYKDTTLLTFNKNDGAWYLGFGVKLNETISNPTLKFTAQDGSSRTYTLKPELIEITPAPAKGISTAMFPIGADGVELLQSHSAVTLKLSQEEYMAPLKGSRAAISLAMKRVAHDAAVADDEQHAIAQAESDAAQAKARQAKNVPLGGVQNWSYKGRKNPGTVAESYEASASVDDDVMSLLYFPNDEAFYLWFTYNGSESFSQEHAKRAEIFIRTRDISGSGRYESDYVFKGYTTAQPDSDPTQPQFVVAKLQPEDIRALRLYDGHQIGAGYFLGENWTTYRLPGEGLWKSFVELAVAVGRTDLLQ